MTEKITSVLICTAGLKLKINSKLACSQPVNEVIIPVMLITNNIVRTENAINRLSLLYILCL